jgi:hypothetical protein
VKTIAILQSSYIPWKGYFDIVRNVDEFVLYDDAQYTVRDWRNRNRIKTPTGTRWLTIPVQKISQDSPIREVRCAGSAWRQHHWGAIRSAYSRAPCFLDQKARWEELYLADDELSLSAINRTLLEAALAQLGIDTPLRWSWELELAPGRTERLVEICRQLDATDYLTGPAARSYMQLDQFARAGIRVHWMSYDGYPEYPQLHGAFEHQVSILDLLFHTGTRASDYLLPREAPTTNATASVP